LRKKKRRKKIGVICFVSWSPVFLTTNNVAKASGRKGLARRWTEYSCLSDTPLLRRWRECSYLLASPFRPEAFATLLVVRNTGDHETKHITPIFFLRFFLRKSFYVFMLFLCAKEQHKLGWQSFSFYNQILLRTNLLSTRIF
jgi:hypothetical protein